MSLFAAGGRAMRDRPRAAGPENAFKRRRVGVGSARWLSPCDWSGPTSRKLISWNGVPSRKRVDAEPVTTRP
jgi:hypothetical protein